MRPLRIHDEFDLTTVEFWGPCLFAGADCERPFDLHHVVARQRIKRRFGRGQGQIPLQGGNQVRALRDRRNLVCLCRLHHERIERGRLHLTPEQLPEGFNDFVATYGLQGSLPRYLSEAA